MRRQLSRELGVIFLDNHMNVSRVVNIGVLDFPGFTRQLLPLKSTPLRT
jgi:hypothetical protein